MEALRRGAAGARHCLPVALGVIVYGVAFGVLAGQRGLSPATVLAMSALTYSGTAQFVALDLWQPPLALAPLWLAALVVSLRYLLICASCRPLFANRWRGLAAMLLVSDENWAVSMARRARGETAGAAHLVGGGVAIYLAWVAATAAGAGLGGALPDPARWGLDFAFAAAFLALLIGMWRGPADLPSWLVAGGTAIAASLLLPGKWYVLAGGLAGSLIGALRRE